MRPTATPPRSRRSSPCSSPGRVRSASSRSAATGWFSLELLGSPALYARAWRKLARGLLADPGEPEVASSRAVEVARRALEAVRRAPFVQKKAPRCGTSLHATTAEIVAGAIAHEGLVYHVLAAG